MNRVRVFVGIALALVLLTSIPVMFAQVPAPTDRAVTVEKTWSGQLVKVDATAKLISAKGPDQKEMSFVYNDDTQVIGPDKTIQGLNGKTGAQLRISYHEVRGTNMATKIELLEKQQ